MAKIKIPSTLASHFGIKPEVLSKLNVTNVTLAVDVKLFIDPLLLKKSAHKIFAKEASTLYEEYMIRVIRVLSASKAESDAAWKGARRLFQFRETKEIQGTCLGYGAATIHGRGWGKTLIARVMSTGKEIIDLGIRDPDIFVSMALFEEDMGPDRISDMTATIIMPALIKFNLGIIKKLKLPTEDFNIGGDTYKLLKNPFESDRKPIILTPRDVLRSLPISLGWGGIADAAEHNETLRARVNEHIAHIWAAKTQRDKEKLRSQALESADAFMSFLDAIKSVPKVPYDLDQDGTGVVKWAEQAVTMLKKHPLSIPKPGVLNLKTAHQVALVIANQFKLLVQENGLSKSLWVKGKALPERFAQNLFFAIACGYCEANNLDLSPEVDSGNGQVDFKMSRGGTDKVLVEIKLSRNPKVVEGFTKQLEAYKASERTIKAIYLVIDVGSMGKKHEELNRIRNEASKKKEPVSDLVFVNGIVRASGSKR